MTVDPTLSPLEFASLQEVAKGFNQRRIPDLHRERSIELRLIYNLIGGLRMTAQGNARLRIGRYKATYNSGAMRIRSQPQEYECQPFNA